MSHLTERTLLRVELELKPCCMPICCIDSHFSISSRFLLRHLVSFSLVSFRFVSCRLVANSHYIANLHPGPVHVDTAIADVRVEMLDGRVWYVI